MGIASSASTSTERCSPGRRARIAAAGRASPGGSSSSRATWPTPATDPRVAAAGPFELAILALNSILILTPAGRQRAVLRAMARLLAPGGLAVVDAWLPGAGRPHRVRRPALARLAAHGSETGPGGHQDERGLVRPDQPARDAHDALRGGRRRASAGPLDPRTTRSASSPPTSSCQLRRGCRPPGGAARRRPRARAARRRAATGSYFVARKPPSA